MQIRETQIVELSLIDTPLEDVNPNKMSDRVFNKLVEQIKSNGFEDPVKLYPGKDGRFNCYAGHHRIQAAKVLGMEAVPAIIHEDYEEDKAKFELFKDNVVRGEIDPWKFTDLFNQMAEKYGREEAQKLFLLNEREFEKIYKQVKEALPKEMQGKLEQAKKEIKTIEDLSSVLNRLFNTYGDTLEYNFMIIDFGGKESIWLRVPAERWKDVKVLADWCTGNQTDINSIINVNDLLDQALAQITNQKENNAQD